MKRYSKLRTQLAVASVGMSILLVAQASEAASIGQTYIHSQQNEPLLASIEINDIDSTDFSVAIASESTYQNMGLDSPTPIRVEFVKKSSNSGALVLTSHQPISEPFADVVLIVKNKGQTKSVPTTLLLPLDKQDHLLSNLNEHALPVLDTQQQRKSKHDAFILAQQVQVRSPVQDSTNTPALSDDFETLVLSKHLVPPLLESNPLDASLTLSAPINAAAHSNLNQNKEQGNSDYQPLTVQTKAPPQLFAESTQNNIDNLDNNEHVNDSVVIRRVANDHLQTSRSINNSSFEPLIVNNQAPPMLETNNSYENTIDAPVIVVLEKSVDDERVMIVADAVADIDNNHAASTVKTDSVLSHTFEPLSIASNNAPVLLSGALDDLTVSDTIQSESDATVLIVKRTITSMPTNTVMVETSSKHHDKQHDNQADDKSADDVVSVVNLKVLQYLDSMDEQDNEQVLVSSYSGASVFKTI